LPFRLFLLAAKRRWDVSAEVVAVTLDEEVKYLMWLLFASFKS